jgi:hypothetical protein
LQFVFPDWQFLLIRYEAALQARINSSLIDWRNAKLQFLQYAPSVMPEKASGWPIKRFVYTDGNGE